MFFNWWSPEHEASAKWTSTCWKYNLIMTENMQSSTLPWSKLPDVALLKIEQWEWCADCSGAGRPGCQAVSCTSLNKIMKEETVLVVQSQLAEQLTWSNEVWSLSHQCRPMRSCSIGSGLLRFSTVCPQNRFTLTDLQRNRWGGFTMPCWSIQPP